MIKPYSIQMIHGVYLGLLKILTKQQTASEVYSMGVKQKQKQKQSDIGPHILLLFIDVMYTQAQTVYIISTSTEQNKNL